MDERVKRLVAIGASIGANCQSCVEFHIGKALELGIDKRDILVAVGEAKAVRKCSAASMDALVQKLVGTETDGCDPQKAGCSCSCAR